MKIPFSFIFALALAAILAAPTARAADAGLVLGLQSYTCRNMSFEEVVAFAERHHLKYLQMYTKHFEPRGPKEETLRKKAILDQHGLVCYTFGVAATSMDKEDNRKLFEFSKLMGIRVIVVEPKNLAEWDNLEQLVKEYDIKLAIHNHGTGTVYGNPETVKKILAARDPRIGVCLDLGWATAAGFDVAKVFREYQGRVFDLHLKDKRNEGTADKPVILDVEIGTGQMNFKGVLAEIKQAKWSGVMAIETDNVQFAQDPNRLVAGAIELFRANVK